RLSGRAQNKKWADLMATNGQFYWPPVGSSVAAYGQFGMAANTGLVELPEELFTEDVVVTETVFRNEARAWSAPVGTPLPGEFGGAGASVDSATSPTDAWQEQKASGEPTPYRVQEPLARGQSLPSWGTPKPDVWRHRHRRQDDPAIAAS
ncbi:hypothetical protein QMG61_17260, partial [Cryobacterium sp. PH31-AA6]|uniref:hypothetical protein n=1 Tax=Cryobacterium sp. PH31-AA6 TaxID=3046205 RepID=UPI0024B8D7DD